MKPGWTVTVNVISVLVIVALNYGIGPSSATDAAKEIGGIVIAIINLYLRLRPLPPEQEGIR